MSNLYATAYETSAAGIQGQDHDETNSLKNDIAKWQCSIRELEAISTHLRNTGKHVAADHVDIRIMSLLEKKIYLKAVAQSRRKRLRTKQQSDY
ncbi:MAG: hypothetical protein KZQ93_14850 [Candidatus Thiodiazotropha sp. (ex Monitilora ramsayi)]|nr:hypothetical protein [Candidatus Thiodiazotropha sp. (ex Monitilora ramsayi)]